MGPDWTRNWSRPGGLYYRGIWLISLHNSVEREYTVLWWRDSTVILGAVYLTPVTHGHGFNRAWGAQEEWKFRCHSEEPPSCDKNGYLVGQGIMALTVCWLPTASNSCMPPGTELVQLVWNGPMTREGVCEVLRALRTETREHISITPRY